MSEREEGSAGVANRHELTIVVSDSELVRLQAGAYMATARDESTSELPERLRVAAKALPRPIAVGDAVEFSGWSFVVLALHGKWAWLGDGDELRPPGSELISDLEVADV